LKYGTTYCKIEPPSGQKRSSVPKWSKSFTTRHVRSFSIKSILKISHYFIPGTLRCEP
jgi:hypothetical protein